MKTKSFTVDYVSRVEGQGALDVALSRDGEVKEVKLRIFEPPKFFEAFLVGRGYEEVMELTSRICGICPVAHQVTALRAVENAMGVEIGQQTRDLRKLFALSAIMHSHTFSMYFLSLPDLMEYESSLAMINDHPEIVKRGLRIKKLANDLTDLIGGRAVHPVTAKVKAFTSFPDRSKMNEIRKRLEDSRADAQETVDLFAGLETPKLERRCEHVALSRRDEYAINEGRIRSTDGLDVKEDEYRSHFGEKQVPYSMAKHSTLHSKSFMVGPLPRVNTNFDQLSPAGREAARSGGFKVPTFNPFASHMARAIELVHAVDECVDIIERLPYAEEDRSVVPRPGDGFAVTEAPRGILYHSYTINRRGLVERADIVPPTAHNARNMETDLWHFLPQIIDLPLKEITLKCEMLIRAYDPCISCSVHFLRVNLGNVKSG